MRCQSHIRMIFASVLSGRSSGRVSRATRRQRGFGVAVSTAINWVARYRSTGSFAPAQMGGRKPKAIREGHRDWLIERCKKQDFTLMGLVAELAERGLKVDYRSVWEFVHAEGLT